MSILSHNATNSITSTPMSGTSLTAADIPLLRLLAQQLDSPRFDDPHDAVEWMGMVQAQDYKSMRWAVAMRTRQPSINAFRRAYNERRIIRTHLFRCTWQLVAAEDLHWMLSLCADRNRRAINSYLASHGHVISEKEYARFNRMMEEILQGHDSMRKEELTTALSERGFSTDEYRLSIYLRRAEIDGIICSGHLDERRNTYALIASRISSEAQSMPGREKAMALLAHKYFRSHSPATLRDFTWWTGLPVRECRRAISAIAAELTEHTIDGDTYYLHHDISNIATTPNNLSSTPHTLLLPPYDEYLIGYKSRHHVLEDDFRACAFSNNGIFRPVIVSNGHIVGNWHPRTDRLDFFRPEYRTNTTNARATYSRFAEL